MTASQSSRDVNAREAIECIRGPMSNADLMERFKLSQSGYVDLLKQLFARKLITEEDLNRRGIRVKPVGQTAAPKAVQDVPAPSRRAEYADEHDEFLDTITLTELLTSKIKNKSPDTEPEPAPFLEEEKTGDADKKGKFSLSGFFKRER